MSADPRRVKDLFVVALDLPNPRARAAFLDRECAGDPDLRRRVDVLLAAHEHPESALERPLGVEAATGAYEPRAESVGAVIAGRYKLVEEVGEGGMGTVWVAQQTEPVKRVVAIKLIKAGMDSRAVLARFEAERQALALMDHPNIARVLDGGATADGRPFFVMELVKGTPITRFCDARRLTPRQRLELFVPVCQAIQHAHQKGVIHRDIKPSNVLVALYDDRPVPKVIDFGIAKAAGQTLTDKTLMTGFGAVVGTPEYMSPEQASLNNLDIDTRSDVYSLGVLLYELLAGSPPFHGDELKKAGLLEMLRVVREDEPPRPSNRLSTAQKLPSISADRGTEPRKLTGLLRNELDWIVMKALEKDRTRRYETVNGFAADVQRYLAGEAVQAHPPSAAYRLRKFARKHRAALVTAMAFAGLLIAAAVVSSWLAVKASRAEAVADVKRVEAETNAKEAKENAELYQKEAADHMTARIAAEVTAKSAQIDLDLSELRADPKVGLLRLARPSKQDITNLETPGRKYVITAFFDQEGRPVPVPPGGTLEMDDDRGSYKALREFVTAAVLAAGQEYAPLLPPITHDGQGVFSAWFSPDKETLLTLGYDHTARLWETRTFRPIAVLRKENERVIACGFSPDGKTVFTDDQTSVARFWDLPTGRYRTATAARKNRYDVPDSWDFTDFPRNVSQIGANRLLTRRRVGKNLDHKPLAPGEQRSISPFLGWEGPVELWDTATGRFVARLDAPGRNLQRFQFLNQGQLITTLDEKGSTLLVFAADDGRLLARLDHPAGEVVEHVDVSPTGRRVATISGKNLADASLPPQAWGPFTLRVWDTQTWLAEPVTTPLKTRGSFGLRFWIDDVSEGKGTVVALGAEDPLGVNGSASHLSWTVYRYAQSDPVAEFFSGSAARPELPARAGQLVHGGTGQVYDVRTWQRLRPPPGRKFHPDLARFASDGRFVDAVMNSESVVIDTRTDKQFPVPGVWEQLPGLGLVATFSEFGTALGLVSTGQVCNNQVQFIPSAERLNVPPDQLELWVQVAVRGHLDDQGVFVKWDEETWEKKRQELAAKPAPFPDFPFPGYVATDKLHWLRAEFGEAATEADKLRLARDLLRRAEAAGDRAEAVRWRAEVAEYPEPAPPPREVKP
jgi:serine/threonine protein kinase